MIHEVFPYLHVGGAAKAIEFYATVFGATEKFRLTDPGGRIQHAELDFGGTAATIHLHVDDADAVIRRAAEAGAEVESEPQDQFYGERSGSIRDPFGHRWNIGHSIEEVTPEEMQRRYAAMVAGDG